MTREEVTLFHKCGTRSRTRVVDIRKIAATVDVDVSRALSGVHACIGYDMVSAFTAKGKAKVLKLLTNNRETKDTFLNLSKKLDLMDKLETFTCLSSVLKKAR